MVERKRFIYWKVIFGHPNGSKLVWVFFRVPESYGNSPGEVMGHMGLSGERERGLA